MEGRVGRVEKLIDLSIPNLNAKPEVRRASSENEAIKDEELHRYIKMDKLLNHNSIKQLVM